MEGGTDRQGDVRYTDLTVGASATAMMPEIGWCMDDTHEGCTINTDVIATEGTETKCGELKERTENKKKYNLGNTFMLSCGVRRALREVLGSRG